ncbi:MAG: DUF4388 domain-containing protein [Desulfobulbaceae bacterium]|nr:DUF4388 domain-containing protein [Desulfobulbaceae bacterium]
MAQEKGVQGSEHIGGISLSSFLQMLEQEKKSCTLIVSSGEQQGSFYFDNGKLIDAQFGSKSGREAVYAILQWPNSVFCVKPPEDRMRRIQVPLAHILLDSAKQYDEKVREPDGNLSFAGAYAFSDDFVKPVHSDPVVGRLIQSILSIPGIKHYFLLNRRGQVLVQSSRQNKIGDFLTYCIVSGIQMKKVLDVKGPTRIQLALANGETLMIMPGSGMIIGLLLDEFASAGEISAKLANSFVNSQE